MIALRAILFVLLLVAAGFFVAFALTGRQQYKRYGLLLLKGTLLVAAAFFLVLFVIRLAEG